MKLQISLALVLLMMVCPFRSSAQTMSTGWFWPNGNGVQGGYGWRTNVSGRGYHLGIDLRAKPEGTPLYAIWDGEILISTFHKGYDGAGSPTPNCMAVRYRASDGTYFICLYGHIKSPAPNGPVTRGQVIAYTNAGQSGGVHLHFGIRPESTLDSSHWYVGYAASSSNTLGFTDPIAWLSSHTPWGAGGNGVGTGATNPQHFIDCYIRNGGLANIGNALADAHWASWSPFRAEVQDFNGSVLGDSTIVDTEGASTVNPACFMYGAINVEYHNVGGPNSGLGYPLLDQRSVPTGGWQLDCQLGRIYLKSGAGTAFSVDGPIFAYYYVAGETGGALRWPTAPRSQVKSPQATSGSQQQFEYGGIYTSAFGTWGVFGDIFPLYSASGGVSGSYGFPKADAAWVGGQLRQQFEGGTITVGDTGSRSIHLSGRVVSTGASAQIEVTISYSGQGTAQDVVVSRMQLGLVNADGGSWQIGDLAPAASARQTFTFTPGFGSKKVSLVTCNVVVGGVTTRLRFKVAKP